MKFHRLLAPAVIVAGIVALTSCINTPAKLIEILSPANGNSTTDTGFKIALRTLIQSGSLKITLNGKDVPASNWNLTQNGNEATITGKLVQGDLASGAYNTLKATATDGSGQAIADDVSFIYGSGSTGGGSGGSGGTGSAPDTTPPTLAITSPVRGQFADAGSRVVLTGTATDDKRVASIHVEIDRNAASNETQWLDPATGKFQVGITISATGLHRVRVTAKDAAGNEAVKAVSLYVGSALRSGSKVTRGIELAVSDSGLNRIGEIVEPFVNPPKFDLNSMLQNVNPIWSGSAGFASAQIHLTRASLTRIDLNLHTATGGVDTEAKIDNFLLNVEARVKVVFSFTIRGSVKADRINYRGVGLVSKSTAGRAQVQIPSPTVALTGFLFDIKGFPDALERLASPYIGKFVEKKSQDIIRDKVAPKIEEQLNNLSIVTRQITVLGKNFQVGGELDSVAFQAAGGNLAANSSIVAVSASNPVAIPLAGSLYTANTARPALGFTRHVSVAVSDDAINQALYEAYRAGATNIVFEQTIPLSGIVQTLTVALLNAFLGANFSTNAGLSTGLPIAVEAKPMLAPVVSVGTSGLVTFQAHDLYIEIYVGDAANRRKLFTFKVDVELPIDSLALDTTKGTVTPKIDPAKAWIEFEVIDQPLIQLLVSQFQSLVPALTKAALPILVDLISKRPLVDMSQLPVGISSVTLRADKEYLVAGVDLGSQN